MHFVAYACGWLSGVVNLYNLANSKPIQFTVTNSITKHNHQKVSGKRSSLRLAAEFTMVGSNVPT